VTEPVLWLNYYFHPQARAGKRSGKIHHRTTRHRREWESNHAIWLHVGEGWRCPYRVRVIQEAEVLSVSPNQIIKILDRLLSCGIWLSLGLLMGSAYWLADYVVRHH
jgi:hypothetical protein